jgi:site-specific DNA recombinase
MKQPGVLHQNTSRRSPREIALDVRVSTNSQQQTQTIEHQLERLHTYVAAHPEWHLAEEHFYRDAGNSGAKLNRHCLDRLRDRAAMAAFERVLMTALDRLARNYVHQVLLLDELAQRGCQVEFLDRPMSQDPHAQLLLQIRGAVAEHERALIADRMRRGRQAKLRRGELLPWTVELYGYVLELKRPRDPQRSRLNPVKAAVAAQIFAWYTDPHTPATVYSVAKRLTEAQIPTRRGKSRWNVASVRGIRCSPVYLGMAYSGRTCPALARVRPSALRPVGPGQTRRPDPPEDWIPISVPAIVSEETFAAVQTRLARNTHMARRHNTAHEYLLRALVSCGQCQLSCLGRTLPTRYHYYIGRGRTDALRGAQGQRRPARLASARALEELVGQDLRRILTQTALIMYELDRTHRGGWLPQALQARRKTLREALAQLERQHARLLAVYLAEIIEREEFERKRQEVTQTQLSLTQQLRQLEAQAQQQAEIAAVAQGTEAFCQQVQPTLDQRTFAQRRQLVERLIARVIVIDGQVEIRYVVPTGPKGETTAFCHLCLGSLNGPASVIRLHKPGSQDLRVVGQQAEDLASGPCAREDDMQDTEFADLQPPGITIAVADLPLGLAQHERRGATPSQQIAAIAAGLELPTQLEETAMALERGGKVPALLTTGLPHGVAAIVGIKADQDLNANAGWGPELPAKLGRQPRGLATGNAHAGALLSLDIEPDTPRDHMVTVD